MVWRFDLYLMGVDGQGIVNVLDSKPVISQSAGRGLKKLVLATSATAFRSLAARSWGFSAGDSEFREGVGRARIVEMAIGWRFSLGFKGSCSPQLYYTMTVRVAPGHTTRAPPMLD